MDVQSVSLNSEILWDMISNLIVNCDIDTENPLCVTNFRTGETCKTGNNMKQPWISIAVLCDRRVNTLQGQEQQHATVTHWVSYCLVFTHFWQTNSHGQSQIAHKEMKMWPLPGKRKFQFFLGNFHFLGNFTKVALISSTSLRIGDFWEYCNFRRFGFFMERT